MEIYVIDPKTFDRKAVIDIYESFIWYTSYNDVGNFELHCNMKYFNILQPETIIQNTEDDKHSGLIETVFKVTKDDGSESLVVKGRMIEALLERRVVLENVVFESKEPAEICVELIKKNAILSQERRIDFEIGRIEKAEEGVIDYAAENAQLMSEVQAICRASNLGFNLRVDNEKKKYIFDTYKGTNRTEEANTKTRIVTNILENRLQNGSFDNGFNSWEEVNNSRAFNYRTQKSFGPYPLEAKGGRVKKIRVKSIGDDGSLYDIWNPSPYLWQEISLNCEHIYYITAQVYNPTPSVISCGPQIDDGYLLNFTNASIYEKKGALYVPKTTGTNKFYMGFGELPEEDGHIVYMEYGAIIDLTAAFGAGKEPNLEYCNKNIYYESGNWKYKTQIIEFESNAEEPLILSRDRDSLIEVEYTKSIINECTHLYIQGADGLVTSIETSGKQEFNRKERWLDLSIIPRVVDGITIPESSYISMLKNKAMETFKKLTVNEIIDGKLYLLNNKKFGKDFYLGDIVCCSDNNIGFSANLRISAATEVWDSTGYNVTVTLGDDIPNITETMKLVAKGAK